MVSGILARRPGCCPATAAIVLPRPEAGASRSARDTMARRTPSVSGCRDPDRTPAAASKAAIWGQFAPEARSSRKNGRCSATTRCVGRGPSGPSNAAANRRACVSAVFFVIIHSGCHDLPSTATPRSNLQQILATKALRFVAIRCFLFHSHLCICGWRRPGRNYDITALGRCGHLSSPATYCREATNQRSWPPRKGKRISDALEVG